MSLPFAYIHTYISIVIINIKIIYLNSQKMKIFFYVLKSRVYYFIKLVSYHHIGFIHGKLLVSPNLVLF